MYSKLIKIDLTYPSKLQFVNPGTEAQDNSKAVEYTKR